MIDVENKECDIETSRKAQTFVVWNCGTLVVVLITRCHNSTQQKVKLEISMRVT